MESIEEMTAKINGLVYKPPPELEELGEDRLIGGSPVGKLPKANKPVRMVKRGRR